MVALDTYRTTYVSGAALLYPEEPGQIKVYKELESLYRVSSNSELSGRQLMVLCQASIAALGFPLLLIATAL